MLLIAQPQGSEDNSIGLGMAAGNNMTPNGRLLLLGVASAWLALAMTARAQRISNWRVYKKADGLPESAC
jgi:hypothetical protein